MNWAEMDRMMVDVDRLLEDGAPPHDERGLDESLRDTARRLEVEPAMTELFPAPNRIRYRYRDELHTGFMELKFPRWPRGAVRPVWVEIVAQGELIGAGRGEWSTAGQGALTRMHDFRFFFDFGAPLESNEIKTILKPPFWRIHSGAWTSPEPITFAMPWRAFQITITAAPLVASAQGGPQ